MSRSSEAVQVLLVDDEPSLTDALAWLLESVKIQSRAFSSATEFLEALPRLTGPKCAVIDLRMPEMSGLELQKWLIEHGHDIPLIFLTAHGDVPAAVNAMQAGAVDFVQKPFNPDVFLRSVNRIVRLARERYEHQCHLHTVDGLMSKLSARERDVLTCLVEGLSSKEIGRKLEISPRTADVHRTNILKKLMVSNVIELQRLLAARGTGPAGAHAHGSPDSPPHPEDLNCS